MISLYVIIVLLVAHYVSDFVMQNDYMARNKSNKNLPLFLHGLTYTCSMLIITCIAFYSKYDLSLVVQFVLINGILHTAVDFFTSRVASSANKAGKLGGQIPNFGFFSIIGIDQLIHYTMLFFIWSKIFN